MQINPYESPRPPASSSGQSRSKPAAAGRVVAAGGLAGGMLGATAGAVTGLLNFAAGTSGNRSNWDLESVLFLGTVSTIAGSLIGLCLGAVCGLLLGIAVRSATPRRRGTVIAVSAITFSLAGMLWGSHVATEGSRLVLFHPPWGDPRDAIAAVIWLLAGAVLGRGLVALAGGCERPTRR